MIIRLALQPVKPRCFSYMPHRNWIYCPPVNGLWLLWPLGCCQELDWLLHECSHAHTAHGLPNPPFALLWHLHDCPQNCEHMGIAKLACANIWVNAIYHFFIAPFLVLILVLVGIFYGYKVSSVVCLKSPNAHTRHWTLWLPYCSHVCDLHILFSPSCVTLHVCTHGSC